NDAIVDEVEALIMVECAHVEVAEDVVPGSGSGVGPGHMPSMACAADASENVGLGERRRLVVTCSLAAGGRSWARLTRSIWATRETEADAANGKDHPTAAEQCVGRGRAPQAHPSEPGAQSSCHAADLLYRG